MSALRAAGRRTFRSVRIRNFRLYFTAQLISVSGTWMQSVAQGWLILQLTGSSVDLGFAVALQYVPILLFGTYGGLVADRHEKRRILYCTQTAAGHCVASKNAASRPARIGPRKLPTAFEPK